VAVCIHMLIEYLPGHHILFFCFLLRTVRVFQATFTKFTDRTPILNVRA
jgi:hypothetical protein